MKCDADRSFQNFSKFLVKDGKIRWFPAKGTKVVCRIFFPVELRRLISVSERCGGCVVRWTPG